MRTHMSVLVIALGSCVMALVRLAPHPSTLAQDFQAPHAWIARAGADSAAATVATAALWVVLAWLTAGLVAILLAALPGAVGRLATGTARRLLPAVLFRALTAATGIGVLVVPLSAGATAAPAAYSNGALAGTLPSPMWPTAPVAVGPARVRPAPHSKIATVQPGDSLWTITAAQLRADHSLANVSIACARVYALNRAVVGPDPDLIQPGQSLNIPADL